MGRAIYLKIILALSIFGTIYFRIYNNISNSKEFFWDSIVSSVKPYIEANNHLKRLNEINFPWGVLTNGYKYQHEKMIRSGIV